MWLREEICSLPGQVVAVDPDLGENGTLVYSIQLPNKFYSLNSTTGKIRTTHVMLDRENPDPVEAELMRKIIVSVTDCRKPLLAWVVALTLWAGTLRCAWFSGAGA